MRTNQSWKLWKHNRNHGIMDWHKQWETTWKWEIGPEEWLRGRDGRETVVEEALAGPVLVSTADAASTSSTAFSSRIEGFVNNLSNFVKVSRENERKEKKMKKMREWREKDLYSFNT